MEQINSLLLENGGGTQLTQDLLELYVESQGPSADTWAGLGGHCGSVPALKALVWWMDVGGDT